MSKAKIVLYSLLHALGVATYVTLLASFMAKTEGVKTIPEEIVGPIMLTLFVISAAVTGSLVLARPIILFFDKKRQEAVLFFISTLIWLLIMVAVALSVVFF
ncbi:MAG: hypothetical protein WC651_01095 [Candidatus Gracilibacteria bacterium]|jgi:hypothetical protein